MSNIKPLFITGANAKIQVTTGENKTFTLAFAVNVSYVIDIIHTPIESMGRYEVFSNEPTSYRVKGSLTVLRYTQEAYRYNKEKNNAILSTADTGNKQDNWAPDQSNPGGLIGYKAFTLQLMQKVKDKDGKTQTPNIIKISGCRITRITSGLDKMSLFHEQYEFNGLLIEDENQTLVASGDHDMQ